MPMRFSTGGAPLMMSARINPKAALTRVAQRCCMRMLSMNTKARSPRAAMSFRMSMVARNRAEAATNAVSSASASRLG